MKLDQAVFGIILVMAAIIGFAMLIPEPPNGYGVPHPEFPSMLYGGPSEHHEGILWVGWAFGVVQLLLYGALMAFGARKGDSLRGFGARKGGTLRGLGRPLIFCMAVQLATLTWVLLAYRGFMSETTHSLVLALPAPTAVLIYVLWPLTVLFNLLFVFGFRRWVLTDEDFAAYERLVAATRHRRLRDSGTPPFAADSSGHIPDGASSDPAENR